jgi:hypothetical protein
VSVTTTELAIAAAALAGVSLVLFVLALRRLLSRQAEVTVTMLRRYDERLATFAQTLNDAIAGFQAPPALASPSLEDDPEPMLRTLELARERTQADGAIALVTGGTGTPIVATVGLSESETNHIARMGFPDYRGARAIEVAFAGDLPAPEGEQPVRGGLVLPLLEERDDISARRTWTRSTASSGSPGPRWPARSTSASPTSCPRSTSSRTSSTSSPSLPSSNARSSAPAWRAIRSLSSWLTSTG